MDAIRGVVAKREEGRGVAKAFTLQGLRRQVLYSNTIFAFRYARS